MMLADPDGPAWISGHRVPIEMVHWVQIKTHADAPLDIDRNLIIAQGNEKKGF